MQGLRSKRAGGPRVPIFRRTRHDRGVTAVEFALVAPLAFLLLMGVIVTGIVVTDQVALTNAVRSGARAAAVCGSDPTGTTQLPDGTLCTGSSGLDASVSSYISNLVHQIQGSVPAPTVTVSPLPGGVTQSSLAYCVKGSMVTVQVSYAQPLYVPFLGRLLGDSGGNTRTINAKAEATCEQ
jgi:Flp pilus assembly protein TadG